MMNCDRESTNGTKNHNNTANRQDAERTTTAAICLARVPAGHALVPSVSVHCLTLPSSSLGLLVSSELSIFSGKVTATPEGCAERNRTEPNTDRQGVCRKPTDSSVEREEGGAWYRPGVMDGCIEKTFNELPPPPPRSQRDKSAQPKREGSSV